MFTNRGSSPRRAVSLLANLWLIAVAITHSDAGVSFPIDLALFCVGLLLTVGWLAWLFVALSRARNAGTPGLISVLSTGLIIPISLALALLLALANVSLKVRLYISSDALLQAAPSLAQISDRDLYASPRRAGLFRVREFRQFDREMRFLTSDCGVIDACGVIYSPLGRPPHRGEDSFRHLYGPWWHWYESF